MTRSGVQISLAHQVLDEYVYKKQIHYNQSRLFPDHFSAVIPISKATVIADTFQDAIMKSKLQVHRPSLQHVLCARFSFCYITPAENSIHLGDRQRWG